jgi:hypothetical protein
MRPVYETLITVPDPLGPEGDYWLVRKWVNAPDGEREYIVMNQHGQVRFICWWPWSAIWYIKQLTVSATALISFKSVPRR